MHRGLVQRVNAGADRVIVIVIAIAIAILYGNQGFLQRLDLAAFLARELSPGWVVLFFREHREDRVSFASRLDNLPLPEIFFSVVVRFEQHVLDLFVGESISGLDVDFSLLPAALFARRDAQNAVGID